jgi:Flp pilus assembly pilin Flp
MPKRTASRLHELVRDQRGAITTEYLVTVAIGLLVATSLAALGTQIGVSAERARSVLSSDSP